MKAFAAFLMVLGLEFRPNLYIVKPPPCWVASGVALHLDRPFNRRKQ